MMKKRQIPIRQYNRVSVLGKPHKVTKHTRNIKKTRVRTVVVPQHRTTDKERRKEISGGFKAIRKKRKNRQKLMKKLRKEKNESKIEDLLMVIAFDSVEIIARLDRIDTNMDKINYSTPVDREKDQIRTLEYAEEEGEFLTEFNNMRLAKGHIDPQKYAIEQIQMRVILLDLRDNIDMRKAAVDRGEVWVDTSGPKSATALTRHIRSKFK